MEAALFTVTPDLVGRSQLLINTNNYSIIEIIEMLGRRELIVNRDYQRGSAIWPQGPSSYFIDTILSNFPFPKIYMYEYLSRDTRGIKREIVDGQQRISAIERFHNDEFPLGPETAYPSRKFSELPIDVQERFLSYTVSVDVIRSATRSEILEMFRRMNAYTLPLNEAEKRHSSYQGRFKWFINQMADEFDDFLVEFGVLSARQIVRMADAAIISDIILAVDRGVVSAAPTDLKNLYKENDDVFHNEARFQEILLETKRFIVEEFAPLRRTFMMKPYAVHSLFTALIHCRYGIEAISQGWNCRPIGRFAVDSVSSVQALLEMAHAHEAKEVDGPHGKYVWGCLSTTDRKVRRTARVAAILRVLGADVPVDVDANLS